MLGVRHVGTGLITNGIDIHSDQASVDKGRQGRSKHVKDVDRNLCNPHEDTQNSKDEVVRGDAVPMSVMT